MTRALSCFLLALLFLSSCREIEMITVSNIQKGKVLKLDATGVEVELTVNIKNPNSVGFNIYKAEFDVSVNGMPVGKGGINKKMRIRASSDDAYTFVVSSDF